MRGKSCSDNWPSSFPSESAAAGIGSSRNGCFRQPNGAHDNRESAPAPFPLTTIANVWRVAMIAHKFMHFVRRTADCPSRGFAPAAGRQRGLGHHTIHRLPVPLDPLRNVVFLQAQTPQLFENTGPAPLLKVVVRCAYRAQRTRQSFPLTSRGQNVENAIDRAPRMNVGPPTPRAFAKRDG